MARRVGVDGERTGCCFDVGRHYACGAVAYYYGFEGGGGRWEGGGEGAQVLLAELEEFRYVPNESEEAGLDLHHSRSDG